MIWLAETKLILMAFRVILMILAVQMLRPDPRMIMPMMFMWKSLGKTKSVL